MEAEEIKLEEYLEKIIVLEEKIEQAEVNGKLEGEVSKTREIAQKMLAKGKSMEEIAEFTNLTVKQLLELRAKPF